MRRFAFAVAFMFVFAGCGSSPENEDNGGLTDVVITYDTNVPDGQTPEDTNVGDTVGQDTNVGDTMTGEVVEITRVIDLNVDTSAPVQLAVDQQFTFRAQIFDTEDNPVANPAVSFTITYVETADTHEESLEYDGMMLRPSAVGDAEGKVSSTFQAGKDLFIYTITVSTKGAESKTFQIQVAELDCACSNITMTYDGVPGDGAAYRILAFDSSVTCDDVMNTGDLPQAVAEKTHGTLEEPAVLPCLTPGATYTVLVTASETCAFAKGCVEGVTVGAANDPENCGSGTVPLAGIDVSIGNVFDAGKNKLTFNSVVPACTFSPSMDCDSLGSKSIGAQSCCYLNAVQQLFADDGTGFATALADAAGLEGATRTAAISAVENRITANTPAWVAKAVTMGSFVRNVMAQTNLESIITVNAPDGEGNFTGKVDWRRYVLFWKLDCDPSDPNYFSCGKLIIGMTSMGGISYAPDLEDSTFTGSLGVANNFALDTHTVSLNPGRLLVYTVNKIAAVTLTGGYINEDNELITVGAAADLKDAYGRWIDCAGIVDDLASTAPAVTLAVCNAAIDAAMADVTAGANAVLVDSHLELAGTGSYTDATCDGVADELASGVYTGNWVRGATTVEMSGNFSGIAE